VLQWSNDGAHSNFLIDEGQVKVNGVKELRRRNKIYPEMIVEFNSQKVKVIASNE
jgi:ribosome-associated protein YbcJ (S4-like RNA binding protein)